MIHMTLRLFDPLRIKRHDQNMCEGVLKIQRREEKVRYEQKTKISLKTLCYTSAILLSVQQGVSDEASLTGSCEGVPSCEDTPKNDFSSSSYRFSVLNF